MSPSPDPEATQDLLEQYRRGDTEAANRLFARHRDTLRRMVEMRLDRKIQQRLDASDIVQDVLVDANRRLADYLQNPEMPFLLWLRTMTRDRIIDAHRRHRASGKRSVDREQPAVFHPGFDPSTRELVATIVDEELTPAAAATMHELQVRFEEAIDRLGEQDQEIILMRHFEHLSNQDIAEALDLTEPAASMRYLRAIRRLRALLSGDLDLEELGRP
ncbi:MAG TPA: sigma-70 family RNA polymerase sigma factor [Pirellulaceae bacterium]